MTQRYIAGQTEKGVSENKGECCKEKREVAVNRRKIG
jgi:hypothetical protein